MGSLECLADDAPNPIEPRISCPAREISGPTNHCLLFRVTPLEAVPVRFAEPLPVCCHRRRVTKLQGIRKRTSASSTASILSNLKFSLVLTEVEGLLPALRAKADL